MKKFLKFFASLIFISLLFAACSPAIAPTNVPAATPTEALTATPQPSPTLTPTPEPTATETPLPTATIEPSPTQSVLPNILASVYKTITITYRDEFNYDPNKTKPEGWKDDDNPYAIKIVKDGQLQAQSNSSPIGGTVFYFSKQPIVANTGVYVEFQFLGNTNVNSVTLGMDGVDKNGKRIPASKPGFSTLALNHDTAHSFLGITIGGHSEEYGLGGDFKFQDKIWYSMTLGMDGNSNLTMKIWEKEDPTNQFFYRHRYRNAPDGFVVISWVGNQRAVLLDNFTVFKFSEIKDQ